jgi:DNA-binding PadR family transcriptional regulator
VEYRQKKEENLGITPTTLLALIQCGLNTPYFLIKEASLSLGITSPGLRRLEEEGLIEGEAGSRNKTEYRLTDKGKTVLRQSLTAGRKTLWDANRLPPRIGIFETLPRALFLLWIYFGSDAVNHAAKLARAKIAHRIDQTKYENQQLTTEIDDLFGSRFLFENITDNPAAIGKSYLLLKAKTDLALLEHQSRAVAAIVSALPAELEGIGKDFVAAWTTT